MIEKLKLENLEKNKPPEPGKWIWVDDGLGANSNDYWYLGIYKFGHNWWRWDVTYLSLRLRHPAACGFTASKEEAKRLAEEAAYNCYTLELDCRKYNLEQAVKNSSAT